MLVFVQVCTKDSNVGRNHLEFCTAFERDFHSSLPRYFSKHWMAFWWEGGAAMVWKGLLKTSKLSRAGMIWMPPKDLGSPRNIKCCFLPGKSPAWPGKGATFRHFRKFRQLLGILPLGWYQEPGKWHLSGYLTAVVTFTGISLQALVGGSKSRRWVSETFPLHEKQMSAQPLRNEANPKGSISTNC